MAQAAMNMGRPIPPLVKAQTAGFDQLVKLYPGERQRCNDVVGAANVKVDAGDYAPPSPDATHIVCVNVVGGGLHWVAQGSNGNFYDPGNGTTNNAWNPVNTGDAMGANYTFAGLWLVIT